MLAAHRQIGRQITGKTRGTTSLPIGLFERINVGADSGTAVGYACDPDGSICENPIVDFYADGAYLTSSTATSYSRQDLVMNSQCGVGVAYRFNVFLGHGSTGRAVTASVRDLDVGAAVLPSSCAGNPACFWYTSYWDPRGYGDGISATGVATGWVCDQDAPFASSQVRLALWDGTPIGTYIANLPNEQAVTDECWSGNLHRFSIQLPPWAHGQAVYAYAEDLVVGEVQIPWLCFGETWCAWQ